MRLNIPPLSPSSNVPNGLSGLLCEPTSGEGVAGGNVVLGVVVVVVGAAIIIA